MADNCDGQSPAVSSVGRDATREIQLHSHTVEVPHTPNGACQVLPHAHLGRSAPREHPALSTLGKGPPGDPATPEALAAAVDAALAARIVLVPASQWPPANPANGVLYLRGT